MQWTEQDIKESLDGHFWMVIYDGRNTVVDTLHNEEKPIKIPRKVWDDEALRTLWEMKRKGASLDDIEAVLDRDKRHISEQWSRRRQWAKRVMVDHPKRPALDDIRRVVCAVYQVSRESFCSESRSRNVCDARQVFYWLARRFTGRSFPQIGEASGRRDHSTVIHGYEKVDQQIEAYRPQIELALLDLGLEMPTRERALA